MVGLAEKPLRHARSGSLSGEVKREHGEAEAERLVGVGLPLAGLGETNLAKRRKGTPQKDALAWWLCRHTAVRQAWVSRRLRMGDECRGRPNCWTAVRFPVAIGCHEPPVSIRLPWIKPY
jgi:hypothetical protein